MSGVGNSSPLVRKDHHDSNEKDMKKLKTDDPKEYSDEFYFEIWCKKFRAKYPSKDVKETAFSAFKMNLDHVPSDIQKRKRYHHPAFADRFPEDFYEIFPHGYASVYRTELLDFYLSDAYDAKVDDTPFYDVPIDAVADPAELFEWWIQYMDTEFPYMDIVFPSEEERNKIFDQFKIHLKRRIGYQTFNPWR